MSVKANNFKTNGDFIEQGDFDGAEVYIGDFLDTLHHAGTGKQACIEHGVTNITDLYDQPTAVNPEPLIINTPQGWVKEHSRRRQKGAVHENQVPLDRPFRIRRSTPRIGLSGTG